MAVFEPWTQFCVGSATATAPCTKFQPLTMLLCLFCFSFTTWRLARLPSCVWHSYSHFCIILYDSLHRIQNKHYKFVQFDYQFWQLNHLITSTQKVRIIFWNRWLHFKTFLLWFKAANTFGQWEFTYTRQVSGQFRK